MSSNSVEVAVIGAGAIGASIAYHLAGRGVPVLVLEKEPGPARHQSGRNSGVIHAGYNLKPGSDKARYCVDGNRRLRAFCAEHGVAVQPGGILVVARSDAEMQTLAELARRAQANGVEHRLLDQHDLKQFEPQAAGIGALHAPEGASFDSTRYVEALLEQVVARGGEVRYGVTVRAPLPSSGSIETSAGKGAISARVVVNAAGLYADRLAGDLAADVRVIPFRGYYAELAPAARDLVRSHIYAAPDLNYPFLGVHLSRRTDGRVIVGPGAMLAFGREAYSFAGVNPRDLAETLAWPGFYGLLRDPRFRTLVRSEVQKSLSLRAIWEEARLLVPALAPRDLVRSFAGNRAQLVDREGKLVDDLVIRETPSAVHVLNAVSPGLTCSLPFGAEVARRVMERL